MSNPRNILRRRQVEARTGKSRSSIYADMVLGTFPTPVKIGARAVGWFEDEIDDWQVQRVAKRDAKTAAAMPQVDRS